MMSNDFALDVALKEPGRGVVEVATVHVFLSTC
jgi:hypothetical protein